MKSLLICGYKDYELAIFKSSDPRITVIKKDIKKHLLKFIDEGLEWLIFSGNKGFEFWAYEVANELKGDYNLQLAVIFNFKTHGENWNEEGKMIISEYLKADFVQYAYDKYENPGQFKEYNRFLLNHTDGCFYFYDQEHETNFKYLLKMVHEKEDYESFGIDFEELEEFSRELNDDYSS
ncbi:SLOG family protein [Floricoccus penangensis]|uniref:SLOG family protein n=1 Tax=Floricoccus penangensis TaxID=1859475 RepID=UPI00203D99CC|nr:SLOG family protein [Floricoccus penangensis]URZ86695.1 DUF1273 family protein [Floricoccus penangensis]